MGPLILLSAALRRIGCSAVGTSMLKPFLLICDRHFSVRCKILKVKKMERCSTELTESSSFLM